MSLEYEKKGDFEQDLGPVSHVQPADYEVGPSSTEGLHRQLKARHIAMISLGGVIGTGLFLGTGGALARGGPLGLFLGYAIVGSICYSVMVSLGEVISYLPVQGGHIRLASRFVDPALGFAMGWNYWYNWGMILPAELSACAILIHLWNDTISDGVWITVILVFIVAINLLGAGAYGEAEFWFSSIKILTIIGLIILSIILTAGGGPDHHATGFQYWRNPGPLVQYNGISGSLGRFLGFWSVLTQAAFSYIGTEIVAVAAGEAKNPRRNIPRAIKTVFVRICLFYLCGTFVIGLICPSDSNDLLNRSGSAKSPFVIAIKKAGIPALPSIINACLITSAASAASSDLYTASRALYSLALVGEAPKIFAKTTRRGLPWVSLIVGTCFALLAFMTLGTSASNVFNYFQNLTACAGLLTWWGIALMYVRFRKGLEAQGMDRKSLPYWSYANTGSVAAYYALVMITIILFFSGWTVFLKGEWSAATFVTNYLPLALFPILWIGWKYLKGTEWRKPEEMDFVSDIAEIEAEVWEDDTPKNMAEKIWKIII